VIIAILPPLFNLFIPSSMVLSKIPSSLLTSILMAWKTRLAGCGPSLLAFAGIAALIISTNSPVVLMVFSFLLFTINQK